MKAIEEGIFTAGTKARLEELEEEKKRLTSNITRLKLKRPSYTHLEIVSLISKFRHDNIDDPEFQKAVTETFINRIYVFNDRLVFIFNYHERTKPVIHCNILSVAEQGPDSVCSQEQQSTKNANRRLACGSHSPVYNRNQISKHHG